MYYDGLKNRVKATAAARRRQKAAQELLQGVDIYQHIAPVYYDLHRDIEAGAHTTINLKGGRGSAKSSFAALEIVTGIMQDQSGLSNAIVFRRYANTLRESVYSQISWAIDILGVSGLWKGRLSPMSYVYLPTGATILFRGLDDPAKLKSIRPQRGTFRFIWLEEVSEIPGPNFLRNVMQSVQRGGDNFTVFRSYNPPISRTNWINLFIEEPDDRAITLHTTYKDIPAEWLGEAFIHEAERLKEINFDAWRHEYGGEAVGSGGNVFDNIESREITQKEIDRLDYVFQGLDFGFSQDPAALVRMAYDRRTDTLYFLKEIYGRHISNTELADRMKAEKMNDVTTYCDCAEPKSIADLRFQKINAKECYKRQGSIKYGIRWLQHRKIVIDPKRTPNTHREFTRYEYERDRDNNILCDLPDADQHTVDAARYGLQPLIWRHGSDAGPYQYNPDVIEIDGNLLAGRRNSYNYQMR